MGRDSLRVGLGITVLAAIHDISLAALFCDTIHLIASEPGAEPVTCGYAWLGSCGQDRGLCLSVSCT